MQEFIAAALRTLKSYRGDPVKWAMAWQSIEDTAKSRFGLDADCPLMTQLWNQGSIR